MNNILLLEEISPPEAAYLVEQKKMTLTPEDIEFILQDWNKVQFFSDLSKKTLEEINIMDYLKNPNYLVTLVSGTYSPDYDIYPMLKAYVQQNKNTLQDYYFESNGALLQFLEPADYEPVAKQWLEKNYQKQYFTIPEPIFPFAEFKHIKTMINNGGHIDIENIKTEQIDLEIADYLLYRYRHGNGHIFRVYDKLSPSLQNDPDVALSILAFDKQHYFKLSKTAQRNYEVLKYVMKNSIAPSHDGDYWHEDPRAIKAQDIPLEVILDLKPEDSSLFLMKNILQNNPEAAQHPDIKKKWFSNKAFKPLLIEIYSSLSQEEKEKVLKQTLKGDMSVLYDFLYYNPNHAQDLVKTLSDEKKMQLMAHLTLYGKPVEHNLNQLGLDEDFLRTNTVEFVKLVTQRVTKDNPISLAHVWCWLNQEATTTVNERAALMSLIHDPKEVICRVRDELNRDDFYDFSLALNQHFAEQKTKKNKP